MTRLKIIARWLFDQLIYPLIAPVLTRASDRKPGNQAEEEK
jgi:hypothetical protein